MAIQYQVIITPDAQQSIIEIIDYLIENYSLEAAVRVNDAIQDAIESLAIAPEKHEVSET